MRNQRLMILIVVMALVMSVLLVACEPNEQDNDITWGEWKVVKAPTMEEAGEIKRTASDGSEETFPLPVINETNYTKTVVVEPSCEMDGEVEYTATIKDKLYVYTFALDMLGHIWGEPTYAWNDNNSSCMATRVCSRDAAHVDTADATITSEVTLPTFDKDGEVKYTATFKETWAVSQEKVVVGDGKYTLTKVNGRDATCLDTGLREYWAGSNGVNYEDEAHTKVIENLDTWRVIPALGHDWGEPTYEWIGVTSCEATRVCSRDNTYTETARATITSEVTPPTFDKDGEVKYTATFKETWAVSQEKVVVGDGKYTVTKVSGRTATCLDTGLREYWKGSNGVNYEDEAHTKVIENLDTWRVIDKVALVKVARKEPTFDAQGYIEHWKCPVCGKLFSTSEASFDTWITDKNKINIAQYKLTYINGNKPTCIETGLKEYWAGSDGVNYADANHATPIENLDEWRVIPALGHDWEAPYYVWYTKDKDNISCDAYRACKRDPNHQDYAPATNITSKVTLEPTFDAMGKTTYTATFAEDWANGTEPVTEEVTDIPMYKLSRVPQTSPTVNNAGNIEYWAGTNGKYYDDASRTNEITLESTIIPKIEVTKVEKIEPQYGKNGQKEYYYETLNVDNKYYLVDGTYTAIPSEADLVIDELLGTITIYVNGAKQETTISHKKSDAFDPFVKQIIDIIDAVSGHDYANLEAYDSDLETRQIIKHPDIYARDNQNVSFHFYKAYKVDFNANGGECEIINAAIEFGKTYGDLPVTTRTGFIFNGWYNEAGELVTADTVVEQKNHTLTANWYTEGLEFVDSADATSLVVSDYTGSGAEIIIPSNVLSLGKPVTEIGKMAFGENESITSVHMPDTIKKIDEDAFTSCVNLTNINIPAEIEYIGSFAFCDIAVTDEIVIPATLKELGVSAFIISTVPSYKVDVNNPYFTSIDVDGTECNVIMYKNDTPYDFVYDNTDFHVEKGYILATTGNATIPSSANTIMYSGFSGELTIPSNIKTILQYGISYSGLTSIVWQDTDGAVIYKDGIAQNKSVTSIKLPHGLVSIGDRGLSYNSSLSSIVIPSTVTTLGSGVFQGNTALTSIYLEHTIMPSWNSGWNNKGNFGDTNLAAVYLYSETKPTLDMWIDYDMYWHYVNGVPTAWIEPEYNITYKGVDGANANPKTYKASGGAALDWVPSVAGYVFDGWYTDDGTYFKDSIEVGTTGDIVLSPNFIDANLEVVNKMSGTEAIVSRCESNAQNVVIPNVFGGLPVTTIQKGVFNWHTDLLSVCIGKNITTIEDGAFGTCIALESISVAEGNKRFYAKDNCLLKVGDFGRNNEYNGEILVLGCKTSIIPTTVKCIAGNAFGNAVDLASITLHDGLMYIGGGAFHDCELVTEVVIPSTVKYIEGRAFYNCSAITDVKANCDNDAFDKDALMGIDHIKHLDIPATKWSLGQLFGAISTNNMGGDPKVDGALKSLRTIHINSGTSLANNYFYHVTNATTIVLADTVTTLDSDAFKGAINATIYLQHTVVPDTFGTSWSFGRPFYLYSESEPTAEQWATHNMYWHYVKGVPTAYLEPTEGLAYEFTDASETAYRVTGIGTASAETDIVIPSTFSNKPVTEIGSAAFKNNATITSVVIPSTITKINNAAFRSCSALTDVTFNKTSSLSEIGGAAFSGCTQLKNIVLPEGIKVLGDDLFYNCTSLVSINIPSTQWMIPSYCFDGCTSLSSITIPEGVKKIAQSAFNNCTSLTSIALPSTINNIEGFIFENCTALQSLTIAEGCNDYYSEGNCIIYRGSKTIVAGCAGSVIPNDVKVIKSGAFAGMTTLTSVTLPEGVTVQNNAFKGAGLTSIHIPRLAVIQSRAFLNCTSLTTVTIDAVINGFEQDSFEGCTNIASMKQGDKVINSIDDITVGGGNITPLT